MLPRQPTYLRSFGAEVGSGLARLSGVESFGRAVVSGVIPVLAFEALGTKQAVSITFAVGGLFALAVTLSFGRLQLLLSRKWVMTLGLGLLAASAALNMVDGPLFALGIGFRAAGASVFAVSLSLLVMDAVQRSELTKVESNRMVYVGVAWLVGPTLGLWLAVEIGRGSALALSAVVAVMAIIVFFRLPASGEVRSQAAYVKPVQSIRRYFDQPYLRIAYAITLCRSMFWVALFVYGPIYVK
ncbi:MAG: MFS transporter, partial [Acidimicrobiia bacterium]|nr:MFS transporter [Acidimicrobiia bacterium]